MTLGAWTPFYGLCVVANRTTIQKWAGTANAKLSVFESGSTAQVLIKSPRKNFPRSVVMLQVLAKASRAVWRIVIAVL